ncbi:MAG: oligosaccharide flippase family protein [Paludibacteraceae bacterium]|nr:oligosaccharide flippase family protein [Paludibacteraceae bacterium]
MKDLVKNSSIMLGGNTIAQIISLAIYPVLSRLYSTDDFGLLNLFLSIAGIMVLFATAEYQDAILLPNNDNKASACFQTGFACTLAVTLICLLSLPFSHIIASVFNAPPLADIFYLIPLYVFFSALWMLLSHWFYRKKEFMKISGYTITQSVFNASAKSALGIWGNTAYGMIISMTIAPIIAFAGCLSKNLRKVLSPLFSVNKTECISMAKEYSDFPKYSLPRSIINNFSGSLPVFILTPFFSLSEIGIYGMALTLAFKPINLFNSSVHGVLYQRFSEKVSNNETLIPILSYFTKTALCIVIPVFAVLYFFLPWLAAVILGEEWRESGEYIRIMLPWLAILVVLGSVHFIPNLFKQQKGLLIFETAYFVLRIVALIIGILQNDFKLAIVLFFSVSTLVLLAQLIWMFILVRNHDKMVS